MLSWWTEGVRGYVFEPVSSEQERYLCNCSIWATIDTHVEARHHNHTGRDDQNRPGGVWVLYIKGIHLWQLPIDSHSETSTIPELRMSSA